MDEQPFVSIVDLAERAGLIVYDTALPQRWVDSILENSEKIIGTRCYPWGFVWGYDDSSIFGEPIPLTSQARMLCRVMAISPRNPKFLQDESSYESERVTNET